MQHVLPLAPTILVTGANGRVGQLVRRAWPMRPGPRLFTLSRKWGADIVWSPGHGLPCTLPRCSAVIALWGVTHGSPRDLSCNTELAHRATDLAHATGATRLFHMSSAAVYGPGRALYEDASPRPVSDYGRAKAAMEDAVLRLAERDPGLRQCCLRVGNILGACQLTPALCGTGPVTLDQHPGGYGPRRSYVDATGLALILAGLLALPAQRLPPVLNLATSSTLDMQDIARAARVPILWRTPAADALPDVTLDLSRLAGLLPDHPLELSAAALVTRWRQCLIPA